MKELSIEEKAKRYDEAIERVFEKQCSEPNWCHHKVDLSDCSEEYRKAYYDGWNNCNMQHSQCNSEKNDVIKCLINGMKFYYDCNENAIWGTDKWSMPVKHIIEVLEKQCEQNPAWSEEDENILDEIIVDIEVLKEEESNKEVKEAYQKEIDWLKSLKERHIWKPSDEQIIELRHVISGCSYDIEPLVEIEEQLKKLREE